MSIFPIPAEYIDAGEGPGQLARRDGDALIPGVPVMYNRGMSDETAQVISRQMASGWPKMIPLLGSNATFPSTTNTIFLDAQQGCELVINGYRLNLPWTMIPIELTNPPASGTRDDLIFLETWFIRTDTGRVLQHRFRVVPGVDFTTYPNGMSDPVVRSQDEVGTITAAVYQLNPSQFVSNDQGLWWSLRTGLPSDPLSEKGLNDALYRVTWALPIARIRRRNSTPYSATINPNGAPAYGPTIYSTRPDNGYSDALSAEYDIVDLRHAVGFNLPDRQIFRQTLADFLTSKIKSNGVSKRVTAALTDAHYLTTRSDIAVLDTVAIPANLIRHSHFESDINSDGITDNWTGYQAGAPSGSRSMATPDGQVIARTGAASSSDGWGVSTTVIGVVTDALTVQFGFFINSAVTTANLTLRVRDTASNATIIMETITGLSTMTVGQLQTVTKTYEIPAWTSGLTIDIYLSAGNSNVTLSYLDVRPGRRALPVMRVTDGSFYPVTMPSGLAAHGCSLTATGAAMSSGLTNNAIAGTIDVVSNVLEFRPSTPPTNADVRLIMGLSYAGSDGLADVLSAGVDKAWDKNGIVLAMPAADANKSYTAVELGSEIAANEVMRGWNPATSTKGAVATIRVAGNGTGTYTLPTTRYGRKVLWPIDCRINGTTTQTLSSVSQNPTTGVLTFTLSGSTTVSTGQYLEVDVVLNMPVLTWTASGLGNGVGKLAGGQLISTKVMTQSTTVVLTAPGVVLGVISSLVCSPIIRADAGESLATAVTTTTNGDLVKLTFPNPVTAGTVVQVLVLVRQEFHPDAGVNVDYKTDTAAPYTYAGGDVVTFLTDPVMLVHTKGTGGTDADPDWGLPAFTRLSNLDSQFIALEGHTPVRSVIADLPIVRNRAAGKPLYLGRTLVMSDLNDSGALFESYPLTAVAPHETILAALVSIKGRRLLLVLSEVRTDVRTALTASASISLYEPNGRPVAPGEL